MRCFAVLVWSLLFVDLALTNFASAQSFGNGRRVTPQWTGGQSGQSPEALKSDLFNMQFALDGLNSQIDELSNPENLKTKSIAQRRRQELLSTAQRDRSGLMARISRVLSQLERAETLVAANDARNAKGEIAENNEKIVQMLNQVDPRFGPLLLPARTYTEIYFGIGENHPDMKAFELQIRALLSQDQHHLVLKLFNALNDTVDTRIREEFSPGRRLNNTLARTVEVLLDTLFIKNLQPSEKLQKLRANVIASALKTASTRSFVDYQSAEQKRTLISNLIARIFKDKVKQLRLNRLSQSGENFISREQAVRDLELASASYSPRYLSRFSDSAATFDQSTYAEAGLIVASLVVAKTQGALLDYTVAVLLARDGLSFELEDSLLAIINNFPKYHRRTDLVTLLAALKDPSETGFNLQRVGMSLKKSILASMAGSAGARTCESLFQKKN